METVISRTEAIKLGRIHFFTGRPCIRGHITKRYVSTQSCVECLHPKYEKIPRDNSAREIAIKEGRTRYFTGKPCAHGHLSERYTSTNGCIACLRPGFTNTEVLNRKLEKEHREQNRKSARAASSLLQIIKLRIHNDDREYLFDLALTMAQSELAAFEMKDIRTRHTPDFRGAGTYVHHIRCYPKHEMFLREAEKELLANRNLDRVGPIAPDRNYPKVTKKAGLVEDDRPILGGPPVIIKLDGKHAFPEHDPK